MNASDVYWHDCGIVRVVESPSGVVAFQVDYPEDWNRNLFVPKTILFRHTLAYEIHEGPFSGRVTILSASETLEPDGVRTLRLETNAGYRELRFKTLEIAAGHVAA